MTFYNIHRSVHTQLHWRGFLGQLIGRVAKIHSQALDRTWEKPHRKHRGMIPKARGVHKTRRIVPTESTTEVHRD